MGIVLLMSAFNRRFSGGGVWFIQDKHFHGQPRNKNRSLTAGSYGEYKVQTADRVQNAD